MLALSISGFEFLLIFWLDSGAECSAMIYLFEKDPFKDFGKK